MRQHVLTSPWPVHPTKLRAGGIDTVFSAALRQATRDGLALDVFSTDPEDFSVADKIQVRAAKSGEVSKELVTAWFGTGEWPVLHPQAHCLTTCPPDVLEAMYEAASPDLGSVEALMRFADQHYPRSRPDVAFNRRFDSLFAQVRSGSNVNFQDFFFGPSIAEHAARLKRADCFLSFHHHESVHDSLDQSEIGRRLLTAMAECHVVLVHTDIFRTRLERILERQGKAEEVPVRRFDLGIDSAFWDRQIEQFADRDEGALLAIAGELTEKQRIFLHENLSSRDCIPHRFACFDRLDPNKGSGVVVDAIAEFLRAEREQGTSLEELQRTYRFFGAHDLLFIKGGGTGPENFRNRYLEIVRREYIELAKEFPGVIFFSEPFMGPARDLLPALMKGCHCLAGGADDGMGLSSMEIAYVNAQTQQPTGIVVGDGAGFAIQSVANGSGQYGSFPRAGSVAEMADAFRAISVESAESRRSRLRELVDREIRPRRASMLISREDVAGI